MKKTLRFLGIGVFVVVIGALVAYFFLYEDYPYFKQLRNVRVTEFTAKNIRVTADVICFNPNQLGGVLSDSDFDIYANGKKVSHVHQHGGAKIPADHEFKIPLTVNFSPQKVFKAKDLLGPGLLLLKKKTVVLRYKGTVKVALAKNDISIPIDCEDNYPLKIKL